SLGFLRSSGTYCGAVPRRTARRVSRPAQRVSRRGLTPLPLTDCDLLVVLLIAGQRRRGGGATPADCSCFAIAKLRGRNMASQVLLGRLHRRDGMRRLMLRFREFPDVVLQRVELAP